MRLKKCFRLLRRIRKPQIFLKVKVNRMICFVYIPAKKKKQILDKIIVILCILQFTKVKKQVTTCIPITFSTPENIIQNNQANYGFSLQLSAYYFHGESLFWKQTRARCKRLQGTARCRVFALCIRRLVATRWLAYCCCPSIARTTKTPANACTGTLIPHCPRLELP